MLWPSIKKRIANKTANNNFPMPNEGGSGPAGGVGCESVVIWATSSRSRLWTDQSMIRYSEALFNFSGVVIYLGLLGGMKSWRFRTRHGSSPQKRFRR